VTVYVITGEKCTAFGWTRDTFCVTDARAVANIMRHFTQDGWRLEVREV